MADTFLKKIFIYSQHKRLPAPGPFYALCKKAALALQNEDASYRPRSTEKKCPGAILDFSKSELPFTIVVPDIHARADFLFNILNYTVPKRLSGLKNPVRVFDALEKGLTNVVLVGDILHAEGRAYERWLRAFLYFERGFYDSPYMRQEMREGLCTESIIMECKARWPKNFHCLKGNHENIRNEGGAGNFPFRKFAMEGQMVFDFMRSHYGTEILNAVYDFEKLLPLCYCTKNIFVSHAEPRTFIPRNLLIEYPKDPNVVASLTWTRNDEAENGSVSKMLHEYCSQSPEGVEPRYLGGHRPVRENYSLRQGGLYIQIHNPERQNIAVVRPDRTFDPQKNIVGVDHE